MGGVEASERGWLNGKSWGGDPAVVAVLREYFRHGDVNEIDSVEYCDNALTTLLRRPFDLVLLLSLRVRWTRAIDPVGYEDAIGFLHQMRVLHSHVPVLVISAAEQARDRVLAYGALAFVLQPVNFTELDQLVARALAANRRGSPSQQLPREDER